MPCLTRIFDDTIPHGHRPIERSFGMQIALMAPCYNNQAFVQDAVWWYLVTVNVRISGTELVALSVALTQFVPLSFVCLLRCPAAACMWRVANLSIASGRIVSCKCPLFSLHSHSFGHQHHFFTFGRIVALFVRQSNFEIALLAMCVCCFIIALWPINLLEA